MRDSLRAVARRWLVSLFVALRRWCSTIRSASVLRIIWKWFKQLMSCVEVSKRSLGSNTSEKGGHPQVSMQTICASEAPVVPSVSFILESSAMLRDAIFDDLNTQAIDPVFFPLPPSPRSSSASANCDEQSSQTSSRNNTPPVSIRSRSPAGDSANVRGSCAFI
jgi:hypothetical protein